MVDCCILNMSKDHKETNPSGFKKCGKYSQKISLTNGHTICVYCLGAVHLQESCSICHCFSSRVLLETKNKLIVRGVLESPFAGALEEGQGTSKLVKSPLPKSGKSSKRSSPSTGLSEPAKKLTKVVSPDPKNAGPGKSPSLAPSVSVPMEFELWSQLSSPTLQTVRSPAPSS